MKVKNLIVSLLCLCVLSCKDSKAPEEKKTLPPADSLAREEMPSQAQDTVKRTIAGTYTLASAHNRSVDVEVEMLNDSAFSFHFSFSCDGGVTRTASGVAKYFKRNHEGVYSDSRCTQLHFIFKNSYQHNDLQIMDVDCKSLSAPCSFEGIYNRRNP